MKDFFELIEQTKTASPKDRRAALLPEANNANISRLVLRLSMEKGSRMECLARYDDEDTWHSLCMIFGTDLRSLRLPLRPRRCDHMVLKLRGAGNVKLYSVARIYEKGSD